MEQKNNIEIYYVNHGTDHNLFEPEKILFETFLTYHNCKVKHLVDSQLSRKDHYHFPPLE